jgi:hypothetical protein
MTQQKALHQLPQKMMDNPPLPSAYESICIYYGELSIVSFTARSLSEAFRVIRGISGVTSIISVGMAQ